MADQQTPRSFVPDGPSLPKTFKADEKPIASGEASVLGRHPAVDVGIGAAKGAGRLALDLSKVLNTLTNPGMPSLVDIAQKRDNVDLNALTTPTNFAQSAGAFGTDAVASGVFPGGRLARAGANLLERSALGGISRVSPEAAELAIRSGGRVTRANNAGWARAAQARPGYTPNARVQEVATSMDDVIKNTPKLSLNDLTIPGLGYAMGLPEAGSAVAAFRLLNRPIVKSTGAVWADRTAPVLDALGGGSASVLLRSLMGDR